MNTRAPILALALLLTLTACERRIEISGHHEFEITDLKTGGGVPAKMGDQITARYTVHLPDGSRLVDITGDKSHTWTLGDETVIVGVDEAILGMRPGGVRRVVIPPDLHYGEDGYADGVVPPKTPLTMRIELVAIR